MALLLTICAAVFALGAFLVSDIEREERRNNREREKRNDY